MISKALVKGEHEIQFEFDFQPNAHNYETHRADNEVTSYLHGFLENQVKILQEKYLHSERALSSVNKYKYSPTYNILTYWAMAGLA